MAIRVAVSQGARGNRNTHSKEDRALGWVAFWQCRAGAATRLIDRYTRQLRQVALDIVALDGAANDADLDADGAAAASAEQLHTL